MLQGAEPSGRLAILGGDTTGLRAGVHLQRTIPGADLQALRASAVFGFSSARCFFIIIFWYFFFKFVALVVG